MNGKTALISLPSFCMNWRKIQVLQNQLLEHFSRNWDMEVKKITDFEPLINGELKYANKKFILKLRFGRKEWKLSELLLVKGYNLITYGLEEIYCVDFIFPKSEKLLFDVSRIDQQELINSILVNDLRAKPIIWDKFIGFENDEGKNYQTIYHK